MQRRVWRHGTVSAVGFGAMSFGGFYGPTNEADSMRTLARALERGVDFWDTANVYGDGLCEQVIGKFLAEDKARRSKVTLATKFAIRRREDGARFFDNSAAHMREALDASRKRLGVDHIDLYYVHRVEKSVPVEDTVGELARLVEAGAIGAIGLSEVAPDTLRRAHAIHPIAAVQSEYSLWTRNAELGLIQACAEAGAILVAFSPLARGYLSGLLQNTETFADKDFRHANPRFQGVNWRRNRDRLDAFLALAKSWGLKPATLAIAWTLARAAAHRSDSRHARRLSSRGMRRRGKDQPDRVPFCRDRASAADWLRRWRALFRATVGRNPEVLNPDGGAPGRDHSPVERRASFHTPFGAPGGVDPPYARLTKIQSILEQ
jgi:aryl-alcohol dehydrogenase-like predicted oxidoreductase